MSTAKRNLTQSEGPPCATACAPEERARLAALNAARKSSLPPKAWCEACGKRTSRYETGRCRSCAVKAKQPPKAWCEACGKDSARHPSGACRGCSSKQSWLDNPEMRDTLVERNLTDNPAKRPEAKAKIRAAALGRKPSLEARAKMSKAQSSRTPEEKAARSATLKASPKVQAHIARVNAAWTPERRSEVMGSPEVRAKVAANLDHDSWVQAVAAGRRRQEGYTEADIAYLAEHPEAAPTAVWLRRYKKNLGTRLERNATRAAELQAELRSIGDA